MYKSQFRKIDTYDWFCVSGSHMCNNHWLCTERPSWGQNWNWTVHYNIWLSMHVRQRQKGMNLQIRTYPWNVYMLDMNSLLIPKADHSSWQQVYSYSVQCLFWAAESRRAQGWIIQASVFKNTWTLTHSHLMQIQVQVMLLYYSLCCNESTTSSWNDTHSEIYFLDAKCQNRTFKYLNDRGLITSLTLIRAIIVTTVNN